MASGSACPGYRCPHQIVIPGAWPRRRPRELHPGRVHPTLFEVLTRCPLRIEAERVEFDIDAETGTFFNASVKRAPKRAELERLSCHRRSAPRRRLRCGRTNFAHSGRVSAPEMRPRSHERRSKQGKPPGGSRSAILGAVRRVYYEGGPAGSHCGSRDRRPQRLRDHPAPVGPDGPTCIDGPQARRVRVPRYGPSSPAADP